MVSLAAKSDPRPAWFVGAAYFDDDGTYEDQSARFLSEGIWENGYFDRYLEDVKSVQPGDRIAIKSTYKRRNGLPFDSRGNDVSVMAIKAIGTVTENLNNGRHLKVDWRPFDSPREWYFYTYRGTVWRVHPGKWTTDGLIAFAFSGSPQDIDKFRNDPYWKERFGDDPLPDGRFGWTKFYAEFADKLLPYRNERDKLMVAIEDVFDGLGRSTAPLEDHFPDGTSGILRDICPFTTMGLFNRGLTDQNRRSIARGLANVLGVEEPVPESFTGIPTLNNLNAWFFPYAANRNENHIDSLWEVFSRAIAYAESGDETSLFSFIESFNIAISLPSVGPRLTTGLYWVRPWSFPTLDGRTTRFINDKLGLSVPRGRPNGLAYLDLRERLEDRFTEENESVRSFPALSAAAYEGSYSESPEDFFDETEGSATDEYEEVTSNPIEPYGVDDIVNDGCFLERERLDFILDRLRAKKNLILQGPPGTGKTWLAKRLAYALMGSRSPDRLRPLQFHPTLSYEDFVRGWRPGGDSRLDLVDGPFLRAIFDASSNPTNDYVVVIEEINRGNPAQIFGEMLTLLESDKRSPEEALALSYPRTPHERIHLPANLYVIGTMNVADRSLALVDLALRRRFAFIDLEPTFGSRWRNWVSEQYGIDAEFLADVERRLGSLNQAIADDPSLGSQFRVGHSVVTPTASSLTESPREWFRQLVETEIGPLLDEYWFDDPARSRSEKERLLQRLDQ